MNKYNLLFFVIFLGVKICFGQFPVSKNIKIGEKEIKTVMQNKGFHYLKSVDSDDKTMRVLYFSEEFHVNLWINEYDNIYRINYVTAKQKLYKQILSKLDFKSWIPDSNNKNEIIGKVENKYTYKTYKLETSEDSSYKMFQVKIEEID
jgi:hypothetical protein